jgi:hypothetical protein
MNRAGSFFCDNIYISTGKTGSGLSIRKRRTFFAFLTTKKGAGPMRQAKIQKDPGRKRKEALQ